MQTEIFAVKNVKCGGCASTIQQGLAGLPGVNEIDVKAPGGPVTVHGEGLERAALARKLAELGYPEAV
ncbi:MAG: heavy-metal-associated domain-containing protein [Pseudomonadota bacterium]